MDKVDEFTRLVEWPTNAFSELKARLVLTEREAEVLKRRRGGETLKALAKAMNVTPPTIRKLYLRAENKESELSRTIKCPCCAGKVPLYLQNED